MASSCFCALRGPKPVERINNLIGSGAVIVPFIAVSPPDTLGAFEFRILIGGEDDKTPHEAGRPRPRDDRIEVIGELLTRKVAMRINHGFRLSALSLSAPGSRLGGGRTEVRP